MANRNISHRFQTHKCIFNDQNDQTLGATEYNPNSNVAETCLYQI